MSRRLALRRETLTELAPSDLSSVAGGARTLQDCIATTAILTFDSCLTGIYPTFDGCTNTVQIYTLTGQ